jgi:hypothetical protein
LDVVLGELLGELLDVVVAFTRDDSERAMRTHGILDFIAQNIETTNCESQTELCRTQRRRK